jgi:hypothetical protein
LPQKNFLDFGFDDAFKRLAKAGFEEYYFLTPSGFKPIEIEITKIIL